LSGRRKVRIDGCVGRLNSLDHQIFECHLLLDDVRDRLGYRARSRGFSCVCSRGGVHSCRVRFRTSHQTRLREVLKEGRGDAFSVCQYARQVAREMHLAGSWT
jgi:hypothetical protein